MSLKTDVDRGLAIVEEMETLKDELDAIEVRIEAAALKGEQVELEDPEREGRQFLATGTGVVVPVILTADLLAKSFLKDSAIHAKVEAAANGKIADFFRRTVVYKTLYDSGKIFRKKATELLGDKAGPSLVTACVQLDKHGVPKSSVKVDWKRAE